MRASPLDIRVSEETVREPIELQKALAEPRAQVQVWSQYPHIVLEEGPYLFTSVHLAMVKSASPTPEWRRRAAEFPPGRLPDAKEKLMGRLGALRQRLTRSGG